MEEKEYMTAERSLEIITEQIERNRRTITQHMSTSLISWGACVLFFALLIAYLWQNHGGPVWNALWAVMWLSGYVVEWIIGKHKMSVPDSFVSKTVGHVWATFGLFIGVIGIIMGLAGCGLLLIDFTYSGEPVQASLYINLTSIISLCFGIASTITGFILKNRIVQVCGFIAGLGGFFVSLQYPGSEQLYVMAAVAVLGLIVPGLVIYLHNK